MYTNLYKGRYMIALYDDEDNFIDSFLNAREACEEYRLNLDSFLCQLGRLFKGKLSHTNLFGKNIVVKFIDCLPQDDQFHEEDIQFLKRFGCRKTNNHYVKRLGVSERTFYRNKKKYERKIKEDMEMADM